MGALKLAAATNVDRRRKTPIGRRQLARNACTTRKLQRTISPSRTEQPQGRATAPAKNPTGSHNFPRPLDNLENALPKAAYHQQPIKADGSVPPTTASCQRPASRPQRQSSEEQLRCKRGVTPRYKSSILLRITDRKLRASTTPDDRSGRRRTEPARVPRRLGL
jgi:hypothetical protein